MFDATSDNSSIIWMCTVRNYVHNVTEISLFLSFLDLTTVYLLVVGVEVIVVNDHTQTHTPSIELLWTSDRPAAETSTWQHPTLTTKIHASGGIRTHNPTKPAAADPRLRPLSQGDRLTAIAIHIWICHYAVIAFVNCYERQSKTTEITVNQRFCNKE